jgi:hypothetical protein
VTVALISNETAFTTVPGSIRADGVINETAFTRFSTDGIAGFDQRSAQPSADLADTEVPPGNVRFWV